MSGVGSARSESCPGVAVDEKLIMLSPNERRSWRMAPEDSSLLGAEARATVSGDGFKPLYEARFRWSHAGGGLMGKLIGTLHDGRQDQQTAQALHSGRPPDELGVPPTRSRGTLRENPPPTHHCHRCDERHPGRRGGGVQEAVETSRLNGFGLSAGETSEESAAGSVDDATLALRQSFRSSFWHHRPDTGNTNAGTFMPSIRDSRGNWIFRKVVPSG
jgi:hypothetical protein